MKTRLLFAAVAAFAFSFSAMAQDAVKPTIAPAVPDHASGDVKALYCNHYNDNNLNFNILGWGGVTTWETLEIEGTKILACQDMKWDGLRAADENATWDFSDMEKFHFDIWVPQESHISVTFEGGAGYKQAVDFKLNEGWNTIDADPVWWSDRKAYDWKDVKYVFFEGYKLADKETVEECTSAEGEPFAFTNLYWWKSPAVELPGNAPAAPIIAEAKIQALFATNYQTRTFNFTPQNWGGANFKDVAYTNGQHVYYSSAYTWDAFTNRDDSKYNLTDYDMFHIDIYATVDATIKIQFEALGVGDGGSGWKNGASVELKANQWNSIDIDLLNAPYQTYDFTDMRYLIIDGFTNEGTPLGVANAYFYNSLDAAVDDIEAASKVVEKKIVNGNLVIEVNGVRYNALGAQL